MAAGGSVPRTLPGRPPPTVVCGSIVKCLASVCCGELDCCGPAAEHGGPRVVGRGGRPEGRFRRRSFENAQSFEKDISVSVSNVEAVVSRLQLRFSALRWFETVKSVYCRQSNVGPCFMSS